MQYTRRYFSQPHILGVVSAQAPVFQLLKMIFGQPLFSVLSFLLSQED